MTHPVEKYFWVSIFSLVVVESLHINSESDSVVGVHEVCSKSIETEMNNENKLLGLQYTYSCEFTIGWSTSVTQF